MLLTNSEAPLLCPFFRCGCVVRLNLHGLPPLVGVSSKLIADDAACTVAGVSSSSTEVWWTVSSHCVAGWKGSKSLLFSQSSSSIGEVPSSVATGSNVAPGVHAYFSVAVAPSYTLRMKSMCCILVNLFVMRPLVVRCLYQTRRFIVTYAGWPMPVVHQFRSRLPLLF